MDSSTGTTTTTTTTTETKPTGVVSAEMLVSGDKNDNYDNQNVSITTTNASQTATSTTKAAAAAITTTTLTGTKTTNESNTTIPTSTSLPDRCFPDSSLMNQHLETMKGDSLQQQPVAITTKTESMSCHTYDTTTAVLSSQTRTELSVDCRESTRATSTTKQCMNASSKDQQQERQIEQQLVGKNALEPSLQTQRMSQQQQQTATVPLNHQNRDAIEQTQQQQQQYKISQQSNLMVSSKDEMLSVQQPSINGGAVVKKTCSNNKLETIESEALRQSLASSSRETSATTKAQAQPITRVTSSDSLNGSSKSMLLFDEQQQQHTSSEPGTITLNHHHHQQPLSTLPQQQQQKPPLMAQTPAAAYQQVKTTINGAHHHSLAQQHQQHNLNSARATPPAIGHSNHLRSSSSAPSLQQEDVIDYTEGKSMNHHHHQMQTQQHGRSQTNFQFPPKDTALCNPSDNNHQHAAALAIAPSTGRRSNPQQLEQPHNHVVTAAPPQPLSRFVYTTTTNTQNLHQPTTSAFVPAVAVPTSSSANTFVSEMTTQTCLSYSSISVQTAPPAAPEFPSHNAAAATSHHPIHTVTTTTQPVPSQFNHHPPIPVCHIQQQQQQQPILPSSLPVPLNGTMATALIQEQQQQQQLPIGLVGATPVVRIPSTATSVQVVKKKGRFSLLKETPAGISVTPVTTATTITTVSAPPAATATPTSQPVTGAPVTNDGHLLVQTAAAPPPAPAPQQQPGTYGQQQQQQQIQSQHSPSVSSATVKTEQNFTQTAAATTTVGSMQQQQQGHQPTLNSVQQQQQQQVPKQQRSSLSGQQHQQHIPEQQPQQTMNQRAPSPAPLRQQQQQQPVTQRAPSPAPLRPQQQQQPVAQRAPSPALLRQQQQQPVSQRAPSPAPLQQQQQSQPSPYSTHQIPQQQQQQQEGMQDHHQQQQQPSPPTTTAQVNETSPTVAKKVVVPKKKGRFTLIPPEDNGSSPPSTVPVVSTISGTEVPASTTSVPGKSSATSPAAATAASTTSTATTVPRANSNPTIRERTGSFASMSAASAAAPPTQDATTAPSNVATVKKKGRFVVTSLTGADLVAAAAQVATAQAAAVVTGVPFQTVVTTQTQPAQVANEQPQSVVQTTYTTSPALMVTQQAPIQSSNSGERVQSVVQTSYGSTPSFMVTPAQGQAHSLATNPGSPQNVVQATFATGPTMMVTQAQAQAQNLSNGDQQNFVPTTYTTTPAMFVTQGSTQLPSFATQGDNSQNVMQTTYTTSPAMVLTQSQSQPPLMPISDSSNTLYQTSYSTPGIVFTQAPNASGSDQCQSYVQATYATSPTMVFTSSQAQGVDTGNNGNVSQTLCPAYSTQNVLVTQAQSQAEEKVANGGGDNAQNFVQTSYTSTPTMMVTPATQFVPQQVYYTNFQQHTTGAISSTPTTTNNVQDAGPKQPQSQQAAPAQTQQNGLHDSSSTLVEGDATKSTNGESTSCSSNTNTNGQQQRKARKPPVKPVGLPRNQGLAGQPSLGKVLYFLDQMRAEVTDADKTLKSLLTDMRLLKERNKELEAKARDAERRYSEERTLREAAEEKMKALRRKLREMEDEQSKQKESPLKIGTVGAITPDNNIHANQIELAEVEASNGNSSPGTQLDLNTPQRADSLSVSTSERRDGDLAPKDIRMASPSRPSQEKADARYSSTPPRDPSLPRIGKAPNSPRQQQGNKLPSMPHSQGRNSGTDSGRSSGCSSPRSDSMQTPLSTSSVKPVIGSAQLSGGNLKLSNSGSVSPFCPPRPALVDSQPNFEAPRQENPFLARQIVNEFDPLRVNYLSANGEHPPSNVPMAQVFMVNQPMTVPLMGLTPSYDTTHEFINLQGQPVMAFAQHQPSETPANLSSLQQPSLSEGRSPVDGSLHDVQHQMVIFPQMSQARMGSQHGAPVLAFQQPVVQVSDGGQFNWNQGATLQSQNGSNHQVTWIQSPDRVGTPLSNGNQWNHPADRRQQDFQTTPHLQPKAVEAVSPAPMHLQQPQLRHPTQNQQHQPPPQNQQQQSSPPQQQAQQPANQQAQLPAQQQAQQQGQQKQQKQQKQLIPPPNLQSQQQQPQQQQQQQQKQQKNPFGDILPPFT